jgi:hypothetical protein
MEGLQDCFQGPLKYKFLVSQIFEFVQLILFLKMCLRGGLAPSSKTVGSILIPPGW